MNLQIKECLDTSLISMDLLLEADPSEKHIGKYLKDSIPFIGELKGEIVGILLLCLRGKDSYEIKNLAVKTKLRGKGIGRRMIRYAIAESKLRGAKTLWIGTGNSSLKQLGLYRSLGFKDNYVIQDYFLENYPNPIFENGIQCQHMIYLRMELKKS